MTPLLFKVFCVVAFSGLLVLILFMPAIIGLGAMGAAVQADRKASRSE